MLTLDEFTAELEKALASVQPTIIGTLHVLGEATVEHTKNYLGVEHAAWQPLAPSTLISKAAAGYPTPFPLVRTGAMRDSIGHEVDRDTLIVGAHDHKAVFHELGTSRMPPRPFLGPAMLEMIPEAAEMFGHAAKMILLGPAARR